MYQLGKTVLGWSCHKDGRGRDREESAKKKARRSERCASVQAEVGGVCGLGVYRAVVLDRKRRRKLCEEASTRVCFPGTGIAGKFQSQFPRESKIVSLYYKCDISIMTGDSKLSTSI